MLHPVKREEKHILKKLHQLAAYLMVFLFMAMPMSQLVHFHGETTKINSGFEAKTAVDKVTEQCKLCDFLAHKQFKEFHITNPVEVATPILQTAKNGQNFIAINYAFTLNGFTNKGPPATFC